MPAIAQDTATIPIGRAVDPQASMPQILSEKDVAIYRRIFDLQKDGQWKKADKFIKSLNDRLLMGHVLYQRYMHPTKYRSRYVELKNWLKKYADHPGARRTYALAMRRKPHNWHAPQRPVGVSFGPLPPPIQDSAEAGKKGGGIWVESTAPACPPCDLASQIAGPPRAANTGFEAITKI